MAENFFNISSFVDDLVPEHIVTDYPELVEFIKVYALYLEHKNKSGFYLNQLDHQRDIDMIEVELLQELQNEIGVPIPRSFNADPRIFYRHLVEFYKSRGTPESIQSFFKLIYGDEVEIYFPKEDMLIPSDGKWYDLSEGIIANPDTHTALYKYTALAGTTLIQGMDDAGFKLKVDDNLVFIDNTFIDNDSWESGIYYENDEYHSYIKLDTPLTAGQVVEVYSKGLFTVADGFASDRKFIQDSFFYQKFSYVLRTGKNIDDWKSAFTRLIHPTGFIFFGEILIFISMMESANDKVQPGNQKNGLPRNIYIDPVVSNPKEQILHDIIYSWSAAGEVFSSTVTYSKQTWANNPGTFVEKELMYEPYEEWYKSNELRDHFENTKFNNFRSMNDYKYLTFEDVINNYMKKSQLGCDITTST